MMIHEITPAAGRYKQAKRVGRGAGSGMGKTCGRGHNGAKSRSGYSRRPGMEGGQMPWYRRLPKRGFSNAAFRLEYAIVNIAALEARFEDGAEVNAQMLVKAGLVRSAKLPVKVLGTGELTKKLEVTASAFSKSAQEKITAAGGKVVCLTPQAPVENPA